MKILSAILAFSFLFNQTVALAETTRATVDVVSSQIAANDPNAVMNAATQMEVTIATHVNELQAEDQAVADEMTPREQARFDRKMERWTTRLTKMSVGAKKKFNTQVDQMDDATIHTKISEMTANAEASGQTELATKIDENYANPVEAKANLKNAFAMNADAMIPVVASNIAKAGGVVPYMIHLKSQIHASNQALAKAMLSKGKADRQIASRDTVAIIVLAALMVLLLFGAVFAIGALIIGSVVGLMIDTVILCAEGSNACITALIFTSNVHVTVISHR